MSTISAEVTDKIENGIMILNSKNFDDTLNENKNILVQFCNMKLARCKLMKEELEKAAVILAEQDSHYKIAMIPIEQNEKFVKKHINNNMA